MIRIPQRFYDDHVERDLEAPEILRATKSHYWIDEASPHLAELLSDARFYASDAFDDEPHLLGIRTSAKATVKAIEWQTLIGKVSKLF